MPVILRGDAWTARRIPHNTLRQHCHVLAATFRRPDLAALKAVSACVFLVLETRSRIFTDLHPREFNAVSAVVRVAAYASYLRKKRKPWRLVFEPLCGPSFFLLLRRRALDDRSLPLLQRPQLVELRGPSRPDQKRSHFVATTSRVLFFVRKVGVDQRVCCSSLVEPYPDSFQRKKEEMKSAES